MNSYMIGGKIYSLEICQHYNAPYIEKWCEHKPQKVVEIESATILWDFPICIERTIQASKPDITIKDHKRKTSELLDFTFPMSINISNNKSSDWGRKNPAIKTSIIPIVSGALGSVKMGTAKYLEKIPGKQNLAEFQK